MAQQDDDAGRAQHVLLDLAVVGLLQVLVEDVLALLLRQLLVQHVLDDEAALVQQLDDRADVLLLQRGLRLDDRQRVRQVLLLRVKVVSHSII